MASIQKKGESWYCQFYHGGKRYTVSIPDPGEAAARDFAASTSQLLRRLRQKLLRVPPGVSITDFVTSGGGAEPDGETGGASVTLTVARTRYLEAYAAGAMEVRSHATTTGHLASLERTLGATFEFGRLALADLQRHVNRRTRDKGRRGRKLGQSTLRREMASVSALWNWSMRMGLVSGAFPGKGLVYPKADEKPPFMTLAEIARRITAETTADEKADLYSCLYLTRPELDELLAFVLASAAVPWFCPMLCFIAHTGARRSEALRALAADVDFEGQTVLIREKKRSRKQRTTRRVPLSPFLAGVLHDWLAIHPGGTHLFVQVGEPKKSRSVRRTVAPAPRPLTPDDAHWRLRQTLRGSKWAVVPGWHCFRHSFISLAAVSGVDQRLIDAWVGHSTEEQRRRYRHLLPSSQQQAIDLMFGGQ